MVNWIDLKEESPDKDAEVLVFDVMTGEMHVARMSFGDWVYAASWDCNIECYPTHWQPLPEPPTKTSRNI